MPLVSRSAVLVQRAAMLLPADNVEFSNVNFSFINADDDTICSYHMFENYVSV